MELYEDKKTANVSIKHNIVLVEVFLLWPVINFLFHFNWNPVLPNSVTYRLPHTAVSGAAPTARLFSAWRCLPPNIRTFQVPEEGDMWHDKHWNKVKSAKQPRSWPASWSTILPKKLRILQLVKFPTFFVLLTRQLKPHESSTHSHFFYLKSYFNNNTLRSDLIRRKETQWISAILSTAFSSSAGFHVKIKQF